MGKTRDLFKKIGDISGTLHARIGTIKDRNDKDLTEREEIKNRCQGYIDELYKRDLNEPDNHNSVVTHQEADILECKVKWALGSIVTAVQSPSHVQLCNIVGCSIPGLSVPHHLPKFAQVQVHCIGDAIQPSLPLKTSSPSALNLSQHQGFFQSVSCSHQMTKILEFQLQHQSFQEIFRVDFP